MRAPHPFGDRRPDTVYRIRPSAYAVVPGDGGTVAVVRTPLGRFLPGGGALPGEDPAATIVREGVEEVGLLLAPDASIGNAVELVWSESEATGYEKRSTFLVATVAGEGAATEPDHELEWLAPAEAIALLTPASHRWAVAQWRTPGGA